MEGRRARKNDANSGAESRCCVGVFRRPQVNTENEIVLSYFVPPHQANSPTIEEILSDTWKCLPPGSIVRRNTLIKIGGFSEEFKAGDLGGKDDLAFLMTQNLKIGPPVS